MALGLGRKGLGRELPPRLAGGETVVEAQGARPAQTPGYTVGCDQVAVEDLVGDDDGDRTCYRAPNLYPRSTREKSTPESTREVGISTPDPT